MRSGEPDINRNDNYYRSGFNEITDKYFVQETFRNYPALVAKEGVNGARKWTPYYGGDYDKDKFDVVNDMWDHEHCSLCFFTIKDGYTYWSNKRQVNMLCDECYDAFLRQGG